MNAEQALLQLGTSTQEAVLGILRMFAPDGVAPGPIRVLPPGESPFASVTFPVIGCDVSYVDGVTGGTDAQASAHVRLEMNGRIASGNAAEPDTLVASARAYLNALNRVMIERGASAQGALAG